jgi:hypothetical protein
MRSGLLSKLGWRDDRCIENLAPLIDLWFAAQQARNPISEGYILGAWSHSDGDAVRWRERSQLSLHRDMTRLILIV